VIHAFIGRAAIFTFDGVSRLISGEHYDQQHGLTLSLILIDLPTLFFMTSFSFFIYYFAKLTMQVETYRSKDLYYAAVLDDENKSRLDDKR